MQTKTFTELRSDSKQIVAKIIVVIEFPQHNLE